MKAPQTLVMLGAVTSLFAGCGPNRESAALPLPDATAEATAALARGDCRLMQIHSHFILTPSRPPNEPLGRAGDGIRFGGTFFLDRVTPEQEEINRAAIAYVTRYNQHVIDHRGTSSCRLPERRPG